MKRGDFLKGLGLAGVGAMLPLSRAKSAMDGLDKTVTSCVLVPSETAGPYPWDLSANSAMYRQDITEGNTGIPLTLTITLVNINDNCSPVTNARVDIWHCNKDGYYSEYANQPGYLGTQTHVNETFFRGIQLSDTNGQVKFTTIYPGWYTGRTTHIHAEIFLSSLLSATTQFAFPDSLNTSVYTSSALYTPHGANTSVANNAADNVFSDTANTAYEMLTVVADGSGGYNASITIGINVPTTGVIKLTPETAGQFVLGQNYPNPFSGSTTIAFSLTNAAKVWLDVYDVMGRKVAQVINEDMAAGDHKVTWNKGELPAGNYAYQLNVENENGLHRQVKLMTAVE